MIFDILFCRDSNEPVMSWIDKNFADRLNSPAFIHLLTTSVVESCIDGVGKFEALLRFFKGVNNDDFRRPHQSVPARIRAA